MAKVKKGIGKGLSNMEKLEGILIDIAKDVASLSSAVKNHVHLVTAAVKAANDITFAANANANDTVTIGAKTYKFVAAAAAANDVKIGNNAAATIANLIKAITGAAKTDEYGDGTTANAAVDAVAGAGKVTITAKTAGVAGNEIVLTANAAARVTVPVAGTLENGAAEVDSLKPTTASVDFDILTVEDN